mgnify:CR=1 FL=1
MAAQKRRKTTRTRLDSSGGRPSLPDYIHNLLVNMRLLQARPSIIEAVARSDALRDFVDEDDRKLDFAKMRAYLRASGPRHPKAVSAKVAANLDVLQQLLQIPSIEREVLQLLLALVEDEALREVVDAFGDQTLNGAVKLIAAALAAPESQVRGALTGGRIVTSGLVEVEARDTYQLSVKVGLKQGLADLLLCPGLTRERLLSKFLPESPPATLGWDDYEHLPAARTARTLLSAAVARRQRGVNLLLYGRTGTGKTELARLLSAEVGARLYVAGRADSEGESATASERLSSLLLGQKLVGGTPAVVLFDELEDLFVWEPEGLLGHGRRASQRMSKHWFNELLETNPAPTVWISNSVGGIDSAFLRRFTYAVEFQPPGARQRARALARHLGAEHALGPDDIEAIAERPLSSLAQLGSAVSAARLLSEDGRPTRKTLEQVLGPIEKLITGADPMRRPAFEHNGYRPKAINPSEDLAALADRLAGWKPTGGPGLSLCLYGPPGTGKSEFARYLASRMGRRVVCRSASDLLSMWVGGTEQNLAQAFREAEGEEALLLFDEIDSLLRDRRGAVRSWEVSQVNELLQQLEAFSGVVVCTTNLWTDLDAAALRRFVFKVEFRYLRPEQALELFAASFAEVMARPVDSEAEREARGRLEAVKDLAPGDFAAVRRQARALGEKLSIEELVDRLGHEVAVRGASAAIGFRRAGE